MAPTRKCAFCPPRLQQHIQSQNHGIVNFKSSVQTVLKVRVGSFFCVLKKVIIIFFSSTFQNKVIISMSRLIKISGLLSTNYSLLRQTRLSSNLSKQSLFFDTEVQSLMKRLTGLNLDKVFRRRKLGKTPERPIYQFMTQEVKWEKCLKYI